MPTPMPKSICISFSYSSATTSKPLLPCPCSNSNFNLLLHFSNKKTCFNGIISCRQRFKYPTALITHCSSTNPNLETPSQRLPPSTSSVASVNCEGLVFGLGDLSSWDRSAIGSPVVKRFLSDEEERWCMWYHGTSFSSQEEGNEDQLKRSKDMVGLAVSKNGIHWERGKGGVQSATDVGMVLNVSEDWWGLDTHSIRPAEVVVMSSSKIRGSSAVYWLYYTGHSSSEEATRVSELMNKSEKSWLFDDQVKLVGTMRVCKSLPGLAMSQDGRHWARIEGEHHSGALFDVGSEAEWDSTYISSPQVVFHQPGDLRMYYHSYDVKNSHFAIGAARSRDGINWIKLGKVLGAGKVGAFDELGVMNACVVKCKNAGSYVMVYEGVSAGGGTSVGLAGSADGLRDWKKIGEGPILKAADGESWDSSGVGSPCLVHMEGEASEWRLYYRGLGSDGRSGIGMAVSGQGSRISGFERWKGFQL